MSTKKYKGITVSSQRLLHIIKSKKFKYLPKVLTLSIISVNMALLSGCQSTAHLNNASNNTSNINNSTSAHLPATTGILTQDVKDIQLFNINDTQPSNAQQAKTFFLQSLERHLNTEHTAVTQLRYHASTYVGTDDIESDDDSLFETFLKVREFQREKYGYATDDSLTSEAEENPFRRKEPYLADEKISKYIRYDDEVAGTVPYEGYDISKETGLSSEYKDRNSKLYDYTYSHDDCVIDYSAQLDDLVTDNPEIDGEDEQVIDLKNEYEACSTSIKEEYQADIDSAIGYQPSYVTGQNQCASIFHQQIDALLSPQRPEKEISYDDYDSIYQTYYVCYAMNTAKFRLEPEKYLDKFSKKTLDIGLAKIQCGQELLDAHQQLDSEGKTYTTDPHKHANLYYNNFNNCQFEAQYADFTLPNSEGSEDDDSNQDTENGVEVAESEAQETQIEQVDAQSIGGIETEYESGDEKFKHDLLNLDLQSFLADYREMKAQEAEKKANSIEDADIDSLSDILTSSRFPMSGGMGVAGLNMLLGLSQSTPAQLQAQNYYAYHPLVIHSVSRYQPHQQKITGIYSYDFNMPTFKASVQMPVELNFKQAQITLDPSAMMPIMAMISPKHTPLPEEMAGKVVTFELPEGMSKIPVGVLQDSFLRAIQLGLDTLNPEYFTEINLQGDSFAQQVGASRGVKLYLGSKQGGELLGKILKHLSYDLKNYIAQHPNDFPEGADLEESIDNWLLYNQGFQAKDVGSILQMIEAIAPISFDQFNYFYFDARGNLIAKQNKTDVDSYISQSSYSIVSQTRFDKQAFLSSPLSQSLNELFLNRNNRIDGNEWMQSIEDEQALVDEGSYARYNYDLPEFDDDNEDNESDEIAQERLLDDDLEDMETEEIMKEDNTASPDESVEDADLQDY
ncbi:hypothetical protein [Psychrobacter sp. I-STPA6b]|uniref:hypothetical protein n=1 Tax=Psychrobacter sp. I-STPA6b TaxID=2585718 RepID=UPI001D0C59B3|nr:hypothetical protein [Psychrobacter sp. I-STPA6b]